MVHETLFWIGVVLLVWGPAFTVLLYANGGQEGGLATEIADLEANRTLMRRWCGMLMSFFFGKGSRWLFSAAGLVLLLLLKFAGN